MSDIFKGHKHKEKQWAGPNTFFGHMGAVQQALDTTLTHCHFMKLISLYDF